METDDVQLEMTHSPASGQDDEISLIDLFAILLKRKKMIIGVTIFAVVFIVTYSVISIKLPPDVSYLPNEYTPSAHMLINDSTSSGGSLSSVLSSSGLGSLASMAGVSVSGGSTYSSLAVYLAGTNSFLDSVVDKFGLIKKWKIKDYPRTESRKRLKKKLKADFDEDSGVLTISYTDIDPEFAKEVVDYAVDYLEDRFNILGVDKNKIQKENLEKNIDSCYKEILRLQNQSSKLERSVSDGKTVWNMPTIITESSKIQMEFKAQEQVYTSLKTQYELLKVQMASETPVFQILERPEVPDMKSGPSRGKLCIIVTFAAFFIAIFIAFLQNAAENIRKDPEAMAKLHPVKSRAKRKGKKEPESYVNS